jgi:hypothetical protein
MAEVKPGGLIEYPYQFNGWSSKDLKAFTYSADTTFNCRAFHELTIDEYTLTHFKFKTLFRAKN